MAATAPFILPTEDKVAAEVKEGVALRLPVVEIDEHDPSDLDAESEACVSSRGKSSAQQIQRHQEELPADDSVHGNHSHTGNMLDPTAILDGAQDNDVSTDDESEDDDDGDEDMWDNESFVEAAFEQLEDSHVPLPSDQNSTDECTREESIAYRKLLRQVGVEEFIRRTLETEAVSAKKLCTAFGLHVPFLEGRPDEAYYRLLGLAIQREIQKRTKLEQWNTIDDAVRLLKDARNVIVVTGAGISTSLGIPDFRSKHNGLYSKLEHLGLADPQEVFEIGLFREDPTVFFSVAKDILPETKKFTPTHAFIRMLQDRGKLLVNYTQNIDNIEGYAGVSATKLIQCHGSFATATCQKCGHKVSGDEIHDDIKTGLIPKCKTCIYRSQQFKPVALKRKRSSDHRSNKSKQQDFDGDDSSDEEDFAEEPGIMKPDITFFGENLPDTFHDRLRDTDYSTVDLVIVIGTSLKVAPVAEIPNFVSAQNGSIPQIYVSRDPCKHIAFDIELLGECDVVVAELCRRAGWPLDHDMAVPVDREIDVSSAGEPWQWEVAVKEDKGDVEILS